MMQIFLARRVGVTQFTPVGLYGQQFKCDPGLMTLMVHKMRLRYPHIEYRVEPAPKSPFDAAFDAQFGS